MNQKILKFQTPLFYIFSFAISWLSWFLMSRVYQGGQLTPLVYFFSTLGGVGPLISLFMLEKLSNKGITLRQIFGQIHIRNARAAWFIPAIFALPVITMLGNLGYFLLGRETAFRIIRTGPDEMGWLVLPIMLVHFATSLLTSPLFEEPGWRGFALGRLQTRFGREIGSLAVGLLWWLWHQPMNLTFGLQPSAYSAISMIALSFMIDSLFNLSGRNLFTAMLAHQSSGTAIAFLYQGNGNLLNVSLLIGFVILLRFLEDQRANSAVIARTA